MIAMSTKPGHLALLATSALALIGALSGCGTSAGTSPSDTNSLTPPSASATARPTAASSTPDAGASSKPSSASADRITIKSFTFTIPASVAPGSKVTVKNLDSENHTVTSTARGAFAVQADAGASATFTAPTKPGSYPFMCTFHPTMTGKLVVR